MGSQQSGSSSRPLTAAERLDAYNAGSVSAGLTSSMPLKGYESPAYRAPQYDSAAPIVIAKERSVGDAKTLSNGDYGRLEERLLASQMAPLSRQKELDLKRTNQDMADRGIYSSLNALRANNSVDESFAATLQKAAADAAAQRYGMQSEELNNVNSFNLNRANNSNQFALANASMENEGSLARSNSENQARMAQADALNKFNLENAKGTYEASWRPADYKAGLWNGTGGVISSGSSGGWSI